MKDENIHRQVKEKSMRHMGEGEAKHRKTGGRAEYGGGDAYEEPDVKTVYAGKDSNVDKEAHGEERKKGGKVKAKKKGGAAEAKKFEAKIEGDTAGRRMDRGARKRGGGVGANVTPLSTANKTDERRGPSGADDDRGITGQE